MDSISFELRPVPPFRLDLTVWVLRRRPENTIDRWDGQTYCRALLIGNEPVEVVVTHAGTADAPRLEVVVTGMHLPPNVESETEAVLQRMLRLQLDLSGFYKLAASDKVLRPVVQRFRGMKPTQYPTLYEALVNGITCQQLSLTVGIRLLDRLTEACGVAVPGATASIRAFPRPRDVAALAPETLRSLGYSHQKVQSLLELSSAVAQGRVDLDSVEALEDEPAIERLEQLRGVGRWTAEYVLLRGMGRLHVFPGDDVGARNGLMRWLNLTSQPDHEEVRQILASWRPYAGFVYFHMLLDGLAWAGYVC